MKIDRDIDISIDREDHPFLYKLLFILYFTAFWTISVPFIILWYMIYTIGLIILGIILGILGIVKWIKTGIDKIIG